MLSNKVIDHCQEQGWWHEDVPAAYEEALRKLGIDLQSDFAQFYLHAEDGPTFYTGIRSCIRSAGLWRTPYIWKT